MISRDFEVQAGIRDAWNSSKQIASAAMRIFPWAFLHFPKTSMEKQQEEEWRIFPQFYAPSRPGQRHLGVRRKSEFTVIRRTCLDCRVVSIGRRNTQVKPNLQ